MDLIQINNYLGTIKLALDPSREMEKLILDGKVWSEEVIELIFSLVRQDDCVLDIGANSGLITLPLARSVGSRGKVVAFEPDPVSLEYLRRNLSLNPNLAERVTVIELGLSDRATELCVYHDTENGNAYLSEAGDPKYGQSALSKPTPCRTVALDDYWESLAERLPKLDFIKADVEGMEHLVFRGAKKIIARFKPVIVFETLLRCFPKEHIQESEEILRSLGYLLFVKAPKGKIFPTSFPNLGEDTVAIPREKLTKHMDTMVNAIAFQFTESPLSSALFWLGSAEPNNPLLRIDHPTGIKSCEAGFTNGQLVITGVDLAGETHLYNIPLQELAEMRQPLAAIYKSATSSRNVAVKIVQGEKLRFL